MNATQQNCTRCDGKGYIDGYSHVQGGVCFKCGGTGKKVIGQSTHRATKQTPAPQKRFFITGRMGKYNVCDQKNIYFMVCKDYASAFKQAQEWSEQYDKKS